MQGRERQATECTEDTEKRESELHSSCFSSVSSVPSLVAFSSNCESTPARQESCTQQPDEHHTRRLRHGAGQVRPILRRDLAPGGHLTEVGGQAVEVLEVHAAVVVEVALAPQRAADHAEV